jgi:endonuclease V-like protein UPF0215 family
MGAAAMNGERLSQVIFKPIKFGGYNIIQAVRMHDSGLPVKISPMKERVIRSFTRGESQT